MESSFLNPNVLSGSQDPYAEAEKAKNDPTKRDWSTLGADVVSKLVRDPALSVARGATTVGRWLEGEDGTWAERDRAVGAEQDRVRKEGVSPRQQMIDKSEWFSNDPNVPSAWNHPFSKIASDFLPSVAGIAATAGTGLIPGVGVRLATGLGTAAAVGFGATEATAQMRDLAENTPLDEMMKLELFKNAMAANNGDQRAARNQFFNETADMSGIIANAVANGLEFGAFAQYLPGVKKQAAAALWKRMGKGGAEGFLSGAGEGAAGEYAEQRQKVRAGMMPAMNLDEIARAGGEAGLSFAPPVAGMAAFHGHRPPDTPPPPLLQLTGPSSGQTGLGVDVEHTARAMLTGPPQQLALPRPPRQIEGPQQWTGYPGDDGRGGPGGPGDGPIVGGGPGQPRLPNNAIPPDRQLEQLPIIAGDESQQPLLPNTQVPPNRQLPFFPDTLPEFPLGSGGVGPIAPGPPAAPVTPPPAQQQALATGLPPTVAATTPAAVSSTPADAVAAPALATSAPVPQAAVSQSQQPAPGTTAPAQAPTTPPAPQKLFITEQAGHQIDQAMAQGPVARQLVQNGDSVSVVVAAQTPNGPRVGTILTTVKATPQPTPGLHALVVHSPNNFDIAETVAGPNLPSKPFVPVDQQKLVTARRAIFDMKRGDAMMLNDGTWWRKIGQADVNDIAVETSTGRRMATTFDEKGTEAVLKNGRIIPAQQFEQAQAAKAAKAATPEVSRRQAPKPTIGDANPQLSGFMRKLQQKVDEGAGVFTARPGVDVPLRYAPTGPGPLPGEDLTVPSHDPLAGQPELQAARQRRLRRRGQAEGRLVKETPTVPTGQAFEPPDTTADIPDRFYSAAEKKAAVDAGLPEPQNTGIYAVGKEGKESFKIRADIQDRLNKIMATDPIKKDKMSDDDIKQRTDRFDELTNLIAQFEDLTPGEIASNQTLRDALAEIRDTNVELKKHGLNPLPVTTKLFDKLLSIREDDEHVKAFLREQRSMQVRYNATNALTVVTNKPMRLIDVATATKARTESDLADQKIAVSETKDKVALSQTDMRVKDVFKRPTVDLIVAAANLQEEAEQKAAALRKRKEAHDAARPAQAEASDEVKAIQAKLQEKRAAEKAELLKNRERDPITKEELIKGKALLRRYFKQQKDRAKRAANAPGSVYDVQDILIKTVEKFRDRLYLQRFRRNARSPKVEERNEMAKEAAMQGLAAAYNVPRANPADVFMGVLANLQESVDTKHPELPPSLKTSKKRHAAQGGSRVREADPDQTEAEQQIAEVAQQAEDDMMMAELEQDKDHVTNETKLEKENRQEYRAGVQKYYRAQYRAFKIARDNLLPYLKFVVDAINKTGEKLNADNPGSFDYRLPFIQQKQGYVAPKVARNKEENDYYNWGIELQKIAERIMQIDRRLSKMSEGDIIRELNDPANAKGPTKRALRSFSAEMSNFIIDGIDFQAGRMENIRNRRDAETGEVNEKFLYRAQDQFTEDDEGQSSLSAFDRYTPVAENARPLTPLEQIEQAQALTDEEVKARGKQPAAKRGTTPPPIKTMPEWATKSEAARLRWERGQANLRARERGDPLPFPDKDELNSGGVTGKQTSAEMAARHSLSMDEHPKGDLISERESAATLINRVKQMIANGETKMSKFVTPQFLDKLSKLLGDVHVYHTTQGVTGNAVYVPFWDRILLPTGHPNEDYASAAVHELIHAATTRLLHSDDAFFNDVKRLYAITNRHLSDRGYDTSRLYGMMDGDEFLAESRSNAEFRSLLDQIPSRGMPVVQPGKQKHSVLNSLYRAVQKAWRKVFGNKDGDTALDAFYAEQSTVLGEIDRILDEAVDRQIAGGRLTGEYKRRDRPAPEELNKIMGNLGGYAKDKMDRTIFQYKKGIRERGFGASLKATFDIAQEGDATLRQKANAILDVMSREHAERGRIMREQDDPLLQKTISWYRKLSEGTRNKVGGFLFDETFHYAFADAGLNDKRNSHLHDKTGKFVRTLANEQIAISHKDMMDRYRELSKVAGFTEHRKAMHDFFSNRENEIRQNVSRAFLSNLDMIPETYTGKRRMAVAEELRQWTFQTSQSGAARAYQSLLAKGIDVLEKNNREELNDIRQQDAFRHIPGPYMPLTRRGDYAVSGTFKFPLAFNATRPPTEKHWQTGKDIDDGTYLFDSDQDARAYTKLVTDKFGAAQLNGGVHYYDRRTGKRLRIMDEEEAERIKLLAAAGIDTRNKLMTAAQAEAEAKLHNPVVAKKYYVQFQNKILEFHPGEYEAEKNWREWREKFSEAELDLPNVSDVKKGDPRQNEQYVSAQFQTLINRYENSRAYRNLDKEEQRASKQALSLAAAKSTMHRGVRQRFQPRGYVQGASNDIPAVMSEYSAQTAGYLAKMKMQPDANEATREMDEHVEATKHSKNSMHVQRVANEMKRRLHTPTENHLDTFWGRMTDRLLKITMFDKLMGAAYLTINATEPVAIAAPLLVGRHPPLSIILQMQRAYRLAGPSTFAMFAAKDVASAVRGQVVYTKYATEFAKRVNKAKDAAGLLDMLKFIGERGMFESAAGVEVQRTFIAPKNKFDRALEWGSNVFQGANTAVENLNRFVTAVTSYRLEMAKHGDHNLAMQETLKLMYKANGQYANFNAPTLFNQGNLARAATQFKKYPQRMIMNYYRTIAGSLSGEHKMENARALASMLIMQTMVAGVLGLPTELFTIPLNAMHIAGLSPYNSDDAQAGVRQILNNKFGKDMGEIYAHGLLRLTGSDVASRMGQESMLTRGAPSDPKNYATAIYGLFFGASGTTILDIGVGFNDLAKSARAAADGADEASWKYARDGLKKVIPIRQVSDVLDMIIRSEPEGMQSYSGRPMHKPYTTAQRIGKGFGFTPSSEAESMEARRDVQRNVKLYTDAEKRWKDLWVQSSPSVQATKLWPRIQEWNATLEPGQPGLTRSALIKADLRRDKSEKADPELLGLSLNKATKPLLKRAAAYNV